MDTTIWHEDILTGKTAVPDDFIFDRAANRYSIRPDLEQKLGEKEIAAMKDSFRRSLQSRCVYCKCEHLPNGLFVGDFLAYEPKFPGLILPEWIEDSVVRIDGYWPLLDHVRGVGIRKDHPCARQEAGWDIEQLWMEIAMLDSWWPLDEAILYDYCVQKG